MVFFCGGGGGLSNSVLKLWVFEKNAKGVIVQMGTECEHERIGAILKPMQKYVLTFGILDPLIIYQVLLSYLD